FCHHEHPPRRSRMANLAHGPPQVVHVDGKAGRRALQTEPPVERVVTATSPYGLSRTFRQHLEERSRIVGKAPRLTDVRYQPGSEPSLVHCLVQGLEFLHPPPGRRVAKG